MAAIDLQKAFDSVQHDAIWRSLRNHSVKTEKESDEFRLARGTKQGGLLNSLLFNSVLQSAMEKDIETWNKKGLVIKLSDEKRDRTSIPRSADDAPTIATSLRQLKKHDCGLQTEAKFALDKTKLLTNQK